VNRKAGPPEQLRVSPDEGTDVLRLVGGLLVVSTVAMIAGAVVAAEASTLPRADIVFSAAAGVMPSSISIGVSEQDRRRYRLALEPDFDRYRNVVVLTLALRRGNDGKQVPNRLDPSGPSHGYSTLHLRCRRLRAGCQAVALR
jgi:hypothetical protein